jgi:hypothetical protein
LVGPTEFCATLCVPEPIFFIKTALDATEWLTARWPNVSDRYARSDIFNAETRIFFRLTPDRTQQFRGENCGGGELRKIALQFLFVPMRTGLRRGNCLRFGNKKNPDALKHFKCLPVYYILKNKYRRSGKN